MQTKKGRKVIVTNQHVCEGVGDAIVEVNQKIYSVMPFYVDKTADICLMTYPLLNLEQGLRLAPNVPYINETIWTNGYPLDHYLHLSEGKVTGPKLAQIGVQYDPENPNCANPFFPYPWLPQVGICIILRPAVETSAQIFPGNSGSPVFNKYLEVVGIMFAGDNRSNLGLMVPWEHLKRVLDKN